MNDTANKNKSPIRSSVLMPDTASSKRLSVRTSLMQFNTSNYTNKDFKEDDIEKLRALWVKWTQDKQGLLRPKEL